MLVKIEEKPLERDDCTPEEQANMMVDLLLAAGWLGVEHDPIEGNVYEVSMMPRNSERYGIIWKVVNH